MRILIVGDPIAELKPAGDTSLAFVYEAHTRGHELWWAVDSDVELFGTQVQARAQKIKSITHKELPAVSQNSEEFPILHFDAVLIRKNPPFDDSYIRLCWLLEPYEDRVVIQNRPSLLLNHHEKMMPLQALAAGYLNEKELVPTCLSNNAATINDFINKVGGSEWILKPWMGYGGRDIIRVNNIDAAVSAVNESSEPLLIQPYLEEIVSVGDRRVHFVGGEYVGDFVRLPKTGDFVSNLAFGGHAEMRPLSEHGKDMCVRLSKYLTKCGFEYAGVDMIGDYITEINVTSPTGALMLLELGGVNISAKIIDRLEKQVA